MKENTNRHAGVALHRVLTVVGAILLIILLPILIVNITLIVKSYLNPGEIPDFWGYKPFIVVSGSMENTILIDDLIVSAETNPNNLKVGDIISFRQGDMVVTHRIIDTVIKDGNPAFITRGDANLTEDSDPVFYSDIEGKYLFGIHGLGGLAYSVRTPLGLLLCIAIPSVLLFLYDKGRTAWLRRRSVDT